MSRTPLASNVLENPTPSQPSAIWRRPEVIVTALGFLAFSLLIPFRSTAMLEPDDFAYRASITALSQGHLLLTNAQYIALNKQLAATGGQGIEQWHRMASGLWISEKNPGYPFFAIIFYLLHLLRLAPLFYGAFACTGLYLGAKKWLGRWGGTFAALTYLFSGAALTFAWRATMPSFTDASLIAGGLGLLLWTGLSPERSARHRTLAGLGAFLALEGAVFIRYTNIVELATAALAVVVLRSFFNFSWRQLVLWGASVVLFGLGVLGWNEWAYGHATSTGYSAGEISFSTSAFWPNLKGMPSQLTTSMPLWTLSLIAIVSITVLALRARRGDDEVRLTTTRDLKIGLVMLVAWLGMWILYFNYPWTANMVSGGHGGGSQGGNTVHVIRFYLPALGSLALLAAWLLKKLRPVATVVILVGLVTASIFSFASMATNAGPGGPVGGGGGGPNGVPGGAGHGSAPSFGNGTPPSGNFPQGGTPPSGNRPPNGNPPSGTFPNGGRPPAGGPDGHTITTSPAKPLKK